VMKMLFYHIPEDIIIPPGFIKFDDRSNRIREAERDEMANYCKMTEISTPNVKHGIKL